MNCWFRPDRQNDIEREISAHLELEETEQSEQSETRNLTLQGARYAAKRASSQDLYLIGTSLFEKAQPARSGQNDFGLTGVNIDGDVAPSVTVTWLPEFTDYNRMGGQPPTAQLPERNSSPMGVDGRSSNSFPAGPWKGRF